MSRAKHHLELLTTKFRSGKYVKPSQFIDEVKDSGDIEEVLYKSATSKDGPLNEVDFKIGDLIVHTRFGTGQIEDLNEHIIRI
ncbi:hypothetical protein ADUPG1_004704, partial [Aduncisulcus paluster]